jgi:cell division protein FtsI (penicillin-binding protein 3)
MIIRSSFVDLKRKRIKIVNLLLIFLSLIFFVFGKISVGVLILILFLFGNTFRLILEKSKTMDHFNQRAYLFSAFIVLLFFILGARLVHIQVFKHEKFSKLAEQQIYSKYNIKGKRGSIKDINGKELAYDTEIYKVIIDPARFYVLEHRDEVIKELRKIKPFDIKNFDKKLKEYYSKKRRYLRIINKVDEVEKSKIDEIMAKYNIRYKEIFFEESPQRKYFSYYELAPVVGFLGPFSKKEDRKKGAYGVERYYDTYLKRNKIQKVGYYANARKILLPWEKKNEEFMETDGNDVYLTIDYYIQYILDDEMQKQFEKVTPESAVGIIMEPSTGKILAMSSYPRTDNIAYLKNRNIRSQYEMGSIFKPLVMAAAYEEGVIDDNTLFHNPDGHIMRYKHRIRDSDDHAVGYITPYKIMKASSNVGMSLISEKLDAKTFEKYLRAFNLYETTGVDLFGELAPRQLPYNKWDGMKKYTMSYGQGIAITPLQMIAALSSTVNGGIYYKPYIVDSIKTPDGVTIRRNIPVAKRRFISEETSRTIREMLKETVEDGTGKNSKIEGYSIGGKTGTAQISGPGGYIKNEYLSSFFGIFPAEDPQYIILIMFKKPKAETIYGKYGAWIAAPVFKNTLNRILKYKGITPENVKSLSNNKKNKVVLLGEDINELPDFRKTSVKTALMIANKHNINISIEGKGKVVEQYPKPGTKIDEVKEIKLKLR